MSFDLRVSHVGSFLLTLCGSNLKVKVVGGKIHRMKNVHDYACTLRGETTGSVGETKARSVKNRI